MTGRSDGSRNAARPPRLPAHRRRRLRAWQPQARARRRRQAARGATGTWRRESSTVRKTFRTWGFCHASCFGPAKKLAQTPVLALHIEHDMNTPLPKCGLFLAIALAGALASGYAAAQALRAMD